MCNPFLFIIRVRSWGCIRARCSLKTYSNLARIFSRIGSSRIHSELGDISRRVHVFGDSVFIVCNDSTTRRIACKQSYNSFVVTLITSSVSKVISLTCRGYNLISTTYAHSVVRML